MKLAPPRPEPVDDLRQSGWTAAERGLAAPSPGRGRRTGKRGRRARTALLLKGVAVLLGLVGVLVLSDGALTLFWQEPVSGLLAHFDQARLAGSLKALEGQRATPADVQALGRLPTDDERMAFFARRLRQTARAGQAVGRIRIPRIGASFVVVAGTDESSLKKGPGIYSGQGVPGLRGTVGIAGHRTTYLAPFRRINELARGNRITLEMPYGLFSYTVLRHQIVSPDDVGILQQTPYDQLVLTACHPLYSASQRYVVFARLSASVPAGAALSASAVDLAGPLVPAAEAAAAILGDAAPETPSPAHAGPGIVTDDLLIGGATTAPRARSRIPARTSSPAPGRPRSGPANRAALPASPGAPLAVSAPRPSGPVGGRAHPPVFVAPRVPAGPVVRQSPSAPVYRAPPPASRRSPVQSQPTPQPQTQRPRTPSSPSPSAPAAQSQTRVQGSPGGAAPIIAGPSN